MPRPAAPEAKIAARTLAAGAGWAVNDYVCTAGPADRPFEERHDSVSISAVIAGRFYYRGDTGRALLHPGALLLGNAGACFECGHEHSRGDRCIAFHYAPDFFAEIAAGSGAGAAYRFPAAMVPSNRASAPLFAGMAALGGGVPGALEVAAVGVAETAIAALAGTKRRPLAPSARDHRRIAAVLDHVERHADDALGLDDLARLAAMSKYHFVRRFRDIVGASPYDYVLGLRLRRVAARLRGEGGAISAIAFEAGFGDLSTFNARFKSTFGESPGAYRRRHAA